MCLTKRRSNLRGRISRPVRNFANNVALRPAILVGHRCPLSLVSPIPWLRSAQLAPSHHTVEEPVVGFEPDQRDRRLSAALEGETDVARGRGCSRQQKKGQQAGAF